MKQATLRYIRFGAKLLRVYMSCICAHAALIPGFMATEREKSSSETRLLALLENDRGSAAVFEGICRRKQTRQRRLQSLFMSAFKKKKKKDREEI